VDDQQPLTADAATAPGRTVRGRIVAGVIVLVLIAVGITAWRFASRPTSIHIEFANTLSGAVAPTGNEILTAARLYLDEVNREGGVDGHPIVLDLVDDKGAQATARANVQFIADGPALAVLGHYLSAICLAAGPGYEAAMKSLVPLFLLMLVVLATLFFPTSLTKERTTIPVTGILTSAVLLISISNQLPSLGYTIALEYIFHVFFGLCLMAMCSGFLSEILRNKQGHGHAIAVDFIAGMAYASVVAITIGIFVWKFVS